MPIAISGYPSPRFRAALAEVLAENLAAADLLGRLHALQTVKAKTGETVPMNSLVPLGQAFDDTQVLGFERVPNTGAVNFIRNLTGYTRQAFDALRARYRPQAFALSGTNDVGLIERVKEELARAAEAGTTLEDFRKAIAEMTAKAGVEAISKFQLSTVFQTNLQRAYAAGHFGQMKDPAVTAAMPYWKYMTAGDERVRPNHAALDGFCARHDDPIWARIYPPNGFNCRCTVIPVLASEKTANADIPGAARVLVMVPDAGFAKGLAA